MLRTVISILLICVLKNVSGQQATGKYPQGYFRQPLDILPPALAGSFGELRANHFHSGSDFRTNQRQGYPVYAVADGYIARLRVQNSGFGLALYINHPNGYTTVYGHLQRYNQRIAEKAKAFQYQYKSYEIDEFPNPDFIPVKKGEIIAWSGNSGASGGPHLHFEIRDTKTEATINPQLFGIDIPDNIPPVISAMYVYRLGNRVFDEFTPKQYFQVAGAAGNYRLNKVSTINLSGEVGFGIVTTDRHNGLSGTNGVYSITLEVDGKPVFTSTVERFLFDNSRAINSHIDYPAKQTLNTSIQKSFRDPGNPLQLYSNLVNDGRIIFDDGKTHLVKYVVTDVKGNKSTLSFNVVSNPQSTIKLPVIPSGIMMPFNKVNEYNNTGVKVIFPMGTLYNDLNLIYARGEKPSRNAYSPVHQIHNTLIPVHKGFDLWIMPDSTLTDALKPKALIVNTSGVSQGGSFDNGFVKASPRVFGRFYIAVDTIAPSIVPLNISPGKNMSGLGRMSFKISDNLSGIKSFNGYVDGVWILMEFDAKTATLSHTFDERVTPGKHTLELIVEDLKANIKKYVVNFSR